MTASTVSYETSDSAATQSLGDQPRPNRPLSAVPAAGADGKHDRLEALLRELARQADAWQNQLSRLDVVTSDPPGQIVARGEREVRAALKRLVGSATTSLAWSRSADDSARWGGIYAVSRATCAALRVHVVVGCGPDGAEQAFARFAAAEESGAQVRVVALPELPCECLVIDDAIGCVATTDAGLPVLHETRDPNVVRTLVASFALAWRAGSPLSQLAALTADGDGDIKRAIVRLLADGAKDETIARSVGVSLRTCRRHVAEILSIVAATSRFQAGFVLAQTIRALDAIQPS